MYMDKEDRENWKKLLSKKEFETLELWGKVNERTFFKILNASVIRKTFINYNDYGEFMFIYFHYEGEPYFAYGLGLHEYRERVYRNEWQICGANPIEETGRRRFEAVKKEIKNRKRDIEDLKAYPDRNSSMFNEIADLADDDYAITSKGE
ncbi:MAG: hypothetical protein ACOC5G_04095 [Acidobacteriota bacterium]